MPRQSPYILQKRYEALLREALHRIPSSAPEWSDQTDNDPGVTLVNLFNFFAEALSAGSKAISNEAFLDFARILGINPKPPAAAKVKLRFEFKPSIKRGPVVPPGVVVSTRDRRIFFETVEPMVLGRARTVMAEEGRTITDETLGVSDGRANQVFKLRFHPILLCSDGSASAISYRPVIDLRILENGRRYRWNPLPCLASTTPKARHFELNVDTGQIHFGDGKHGRIPPRNSQISATYRTGGGRKGNVAARSVTRLETRVSGILGVTNPKSASGGRDAESLIDTRKRVVTELRHRSRKDACVDYIHR